MVVACDIYLLSYEVNQQLCYFHSLVVKDINRSIYCNCNFIGGMSTYSLLQHQFKISFFLIDIHMIK